MRCVCKKWRSIMESQGFREAYSGVPMQPSCFLHLIMVNGVLLAAFHNPTIGHWQRFSLDCILVDGYPVSFEPSRWELGRRVGHRDGRLRWESVSSDEGLECSPSGKHQHLRPET
ncbi:hypothetical protein KC19_VG117600 [Ceratodon purpureus]|uniref:F-box domain-containing protein n=1 Tax=Ceratodon purpureus TaxID=3225 RepID=A0A8T0HP84_CERPU|nr:hypothetical protein KC19_VG117600 [Ceratodon purpureus]